MMKLTTMALYFSGINWEITDPLKRCEKYISNIEYEYFNETIKLPRKLKKKRRKQLNKEWRFWVSLRESRLFN